MQKSEGVMQQLGAVHVRQEIFDFLKSLPLGQSARWRRRAYDLLFQQQLESAEATEDVSAAEAEEELLVKGEDMGTFDDLTDGMFLEGIEITITNAKTLVFDYGGSKTPAPGIMLTYQSPSLQKPAEQFYSCGDIKDLKPTADGKDFEFLSGRKKLTKSSNGGLFLQALGELGFSLALIANDITQLVGMKGVLKSFKPPQGGDFERKPILVFREILSMPGGQTSQPQQEVPATDPAIEDWAKQTIAPLLQQAQPNGLPVADVNQQVVAAAYAQQKDAASVQKLFSGDKWLMDNYIINNGVVMQPK